MSAHEPAYRCVESVEVPANSRPSLTPLDVEWLRCLADGMTLPEIGQRYGYSAQTIKNRVSKIYGHLGVTPRRRGALVKRAFELGLLLVLALVPTTALAQQTPNQVTLNPDNPIAVTGAGCAPTLDSGLLTCPTWTPTPPATSTPVPATDTPTPAPTDTPVPTVIVATSTIQPVQIQVGTRHVQPYAMHAGWTEVIDAYLLSPDERRVNVALQITNAQGVLFWAATLGVTTLAGGETDVSANWTLPLSTPVDTYYVEIAVRDPATGVDIVPLAPLFKFPSAPPVS